MKCYFQLLKEFAIVLLRVQCSKYESVFLSLYYAMKMILEGSSRDTISHSFSRPIRSITVY